MPERSRDGDDNGRSGDREESDEDDPLDAFMAGVEVCVIFLFYFVYVLDIYLFGKMYIVYFKYV